MVKIAVLPTQTPQRNVAAEAAGISLTTCKAVGKSTGYLLSSKTNPAVYTASESDMYYMIYSEDIANSLSMRLQHRPAHLARLQALSEAGKLLLAGPTPAIDSTEPGEAGFSGSLVVAEFASLAEAQAWAAQDPFILQGVYARSTVKPFKKVLP